MISISSPRALPLLVAGTMFMEQYPSQMLYDFFKAVSDQSEIARITKTTPETGDLIGGERYHDTLWLLEPEA